ncbi:MAG: HAD-IC family P-type ATPase, partial [Deltaproteobacteria bacterium]|nr:HAD-IC family P-type ATPase [Deltaproteobacteria bacterium]
MAAPLQEYYQLEIDEVLTALGTTATGLSRSEAESRLKEFGPNELQEKRQVPLWLLFLAQFKELLIIILLIGGVISYLIGNYRDGSIIFIIVIVNAVIGFHHENKAGRIVARLKNLIRSPAKVMRDNQLVEIHQENLVVGDIIRLETGDKVPADIRLLEIHEFKTSDFALTGESVPQEKEVAALSGDLALGDRINMAYAGTMVATGNATGVVVACGMATETGKIAGLVESAGVTQTPLQKELRRLANQLTVAVVIIGVALFILGIMQEFSLYMSLVYALGVAMAMVPQALPAQVTVALSTGSNQLADRQAVVKSLPSVETLGATTVICTDKTGTLTKNEMTVQSIWFNNTTYKVTGVGYEPRGDLQQESGKAVAEAEKQALTLIIQVATLASNAEIHEPDEEHPSWHPIGDPTEAALITLGTKLNVRSPNENEEFPKLHEFPFDGELMRMSSVRQFTDGPRLAAKGSTASILEICNRSYRNGKTEPLDDSERQKIMAINEEYSANGMRVLAF